MLVDRYDEICSTHKFLKDNYKKYDSNVVIVADKQTSGIGTNGRSWYTGCNNNIAMSILYRPHCNISDLDGLTIRVAEILKDEILNSFGILLYIKKPNDLMLNNKKVCGILTEVSSIGDKINYLIISIGFNVNDVDFPYELENIATSLSKETGKEFDKDYILSKFIEDLEQII